MNYTAKQGQYLAFIYHYSLLNRRAPAEFDIQMYFRVSAPTVHQMIVTLDRKDLFRERLAQGTERGGIRMTFQGLLGPNSRLTLLDGGSYTSFGTAGFAIP